MLCSSRADISTTTTPWEKKHTHAKRVPLPCLSIHYCTYSTCRTTCIAGIKINKMPNTNCTGAGKRSSSSQAPTRTALHRDRRAGPSKRKRSHFSSARFILFSETLNSVAAHHRRNTTSFPRPRGNRLNGPSPFPLRAHTYAAKNKLRRITHVHEAKRALVMLPLGLVHLSTTKQGGGTVEPRAEWGEG